MQPSPSSISRTLFTFSTETVLLNKFLLSRWLGGKESIYNAGDTGSIPELGRYPGEGNGNPLQYSCLGNFMDRGTWRAQSMESQRQTLVSHWLHTHISSSCSPWQTPFYFPSLWIWLLYLMLVESQSAYLLMTDISVSIITPKFTHVATYHIFLSFLRLHVIPLYAYSIFCLSIYLKINAFGLTPC